MAIMLVTDAVAIKIDGDSPLELVDLGIISATTKYYKLDLISSMPFLAGAFMPPRSEACVAMCGTTTKKSLFKKSSL